MHHLHNSSLIVDAQGNSLGENSAGGHLNSAAMLMTLGSSLSSNGVSGLGTATNSLNTSMPEINKIIFGRELVKHKYAEIYINLKKIFLLMNLKTFFLS